MSATVYRAVHRGSLKTIAIGTAAELRVEIPESKWDDVALYTSLDGPLEGYTHTHARDVLGVRTYGAVYVTVGKNDKPRFHSFARGRLWPMSRESAEASFAAGATVYRKQPGVSIWQEAPEVFVG